MPRTTTSRQWLPKELVHWRLETSSPKLLLEREADVAFEFFERGLMAGALGRQAGDRALGQRVAAVDAAERGATRVRGW